MASSTSVAVARPPAHALPGTLPDAELFAGVRAAGPSADDCRNELVARYAPLAASLARRYPGRGESDDDLRQVAHLGLLEAMDRFDPDRGVAFAGFAHPTILGLLRPHFRDARGWVRRAPPAGTLCRDPRRPGAAGRS